MSFEKIDVHAHFLPPFYREALREAGHATPDGFPRIPEWSPEIHLAFMNANNIKKSYLSISSPGIFLKPPRHSPGNASSAAASLARRCNEYASTLKRAHPDRFGHFAVLPLPDIPASLAEIDHCTANLAHDGFALLTNAQGMYLADPAMDPIWSRLDALAAVVYTHPTGPCCALPGPDDPQLRRKATVPLGHAYASPLLEFLFDTTRAFADVLLTGLPQRYPRIRFIVSHTGACLPSVMDRVIAFSGLLAQAGSERGEAQQLTEESVKELFADRFFFDLAGMPMKGPLLHMLRWVDHTRLMYGSDVPFMAPEQAGGLVGLIKEGLETAFDGDQDKIKCICHGNAEKLFSSGSNSGQH